MWKFLQCSSSPKVKRPKGRCRWKECQNKVLRLFGSYYCDVHTCLHNRLECICHVIDGSVCCQTHVCAKEGCIAYNNGHACCPEHECGASFCRHLKIDGSLYCPEHTCLHPECMQYVDRSGYCPLHRCLHEICSLPKHGNLNYCINHICQDPECSLHASDIYCVEHKCPYRDCDNPHLGKKTCATHICTEKGCDEVQHFGEYKCVEHMLLG